MVWKAPLRRSDVLYRFGPIYISFGVQYYRSRICRRRISIGFTTKSYGYVRHFIYGSFKDATLEMDDV